MVTDTVSVTNGGKRGWLIASKLRASVMYCDFQENLLLLQRRLTAAMNRASVFATWRMHTANFQTSRRLLNFICMPHRQQRTQVNGYHAVMLALYFTFSVA